jgi:anthranilate synthase component 1
MVLFLFQKVYVIHWVNVDRHASVEAAYQDGRSRLDLLLSKVHNSNV